MHQELHVVLGASGGAGRAITAELARRGMAVRAVNRSGSVSVPSAEVRAGDVETADGARRAVEGAAVVYMAAQPPYHQWPQRFPAMLSHVIDATASAGAKLVMVDNLYGHGPGAGVLTEQTPERATDHKGRTRRELTRVLAEAHRSGRVRVATGRLSDYFGPHGDNSSVTALAIEPAAAGKTLRWFASLDVLHSVAYLPDVARAFVTLGTSERADGRTWILPHAPAVTGRQFHDLVNRALPAPSKSAVLSTAMLRLAAPFHRISRESLSISYQWAAPFVVDDGAFRREFGPFEVTPLEQAVADTVTWYRERHRSRPAAGGPLPRRGAAR